MIHEQQLLYNGLTTTWTFFTLKSTKKCLNMWKHKERVMIKKNLNKISIWKSKEYFTLLYSRLRLNHIRFSWHSPETHMNSLKKKNLTGRKLSSLETAMYSYLVALRVGPDRKLGQFLWLSESLCNFFLKPLPFGKLSNLLSVSIQNCTVP